MKKEYGKPLRVSNHRPCVVCGKPDYCMYSRDGVIAYCTRVQSGSFKFSQAYNAYMHRLTGDRVITVDNVNSDSDAPHVPAAPLDRRHAAYTDFLSRLKIDSDTHVDLTRRGLPLSVIERNGYRSTIDEQAGREMAMQLSRIHDLTHVPGFYLERKSWRMAWMPHGYFIPYRNVEGKIQGLSIRRLDGQGDRKFIWFSSGPDREGKIRPSGAGSGSPVHAVGVAAVDDLLLTEGALKADIINYFSGESLFAAAGVTNFGANFAENLRRAYPNLARVVIAYDMDSLNNEFVYKPLMRLARSLEKARFDVKVRTWDGAKGYDNYLFAQSQQREVAA